MILVNIQMIPDSNFCRTSNHILMTIKESRPRELTMNKLVNDNNFVSGNTVTSSDDKDLTNNSRASFYALQVALQTMKERCQQLQQRLFAVEEENLKLRIENQKLSINLPDDSKGEIIALHEHIAQLTRQKSQLTHHIFMVATENKQLWTRLSRLTEANYSLGSQLTKISDTLNKHSLGESSKPNQSIQIMNSCDKHVDTIGLEQKDESLEEISLKIISSIIREKMELEQQCDQMSALQTGTLSVEDCEFTLGTDNGEQEELNQDLRKVLDSLREQKETLQRQQAGLRGTLVTLTSLVKNGMSCKKCKNRDKSQPATSGPTLNGDKNHVDQKLKTINGVSEPPLDPEDNRISQGDGFEVYEDRICPLCSQFFHRTTEFEEFHSHVLTHFPSDEDAAFDSLSSNDCQVD